ncbi:MAG: polysaccharide biosynthesis tyrosine autokinase [Atopobiaceae bacterium]
MARKPAGVDRVALQNAVKTLAANIRFSSVDKPIHSIAVVSSVPDEGKTTVTSCLGRAFAESGASVLLVECDMRRRSLASALGAHGRHGIYAVLSGRHTVQESVVSVSTGLYFLDAEPGIPNPADILQSKRFHELVHTLTQTYNYVIFDTPPVLSVVDGVVVASVVDATLLVVRQDFTRREDVSNSYAQLKQAGANVIGTVLNCTDEVASSRYYYSYQHQKGAEDYEAVRGPVSNVPAQQPAGRQAVPQVAPVSESHAAASVTPAAVSPRAVTPQRQAATEGRRIFSPANGGKTDASSAAPDQTSQFLASAGYTPRYTPHGYDEDE